MARMEKPPLRMRPSWWKLRSPAMGNSPVTKKTQLSASRSAHSTRPPFAGLTPHILQRRIARKVHHLAQGHAVCVFRAPMLQFPSRVRVPPSGSTELDVGRQVDETRVNRDPDAQRCFEVAGEKMLLWSPIHVSQCLWLSWSLQVP